MSADNIIIRRAKRTGGKAGKGYNKTSTIQVLEVHEDYYVKLAQFRFKTDDIESYYAAIDKARQYVEKTRSISNDQLCTGHK